MERLETRRQLSLFIPEPWGSVVDSVRAQADPVQHALIPAHATLVRDEDVDDWSVVRVRLNLLGPIRMELSVGEVQGCDYDGAYLPLEGPTHEYDRLRQVLLFDQPGCSRTQAPHITLMHPRNRANFGMQFANLKAVKFPPAVTFDQVVMIAQSRGRPWKVVASSPHYS